MTKIEELIKQYCPEGVEYRTLGELGIFLRGLSGKSKEDFKNGNEKFITYMNVFKNIQVDVDVTDTVKIEDGEKQNIIQYGDVLFTGSSETLDECGMSSVLTVNTDEKLYLNSFCFIYRFNDLKLFLPSFTKYLFRSDNLRKQIIKTASGVTRFNVSKTRMSKIVIPLPPLPVQREIVRILDKFTELTKELTKELNKRKLQYQWYRDHLLDFGTRGGATRWVTLEDIFNIRNGYTPSKANVEYWQNGVIPWFRMEDIRTNGRILSDAIQRITTEAVKNKPFPADSIIVSTTATIGEHALITKPFLSNQRFTCLSLKEEYKDKYNIKFLFYYCCKLDEFCLKNVNQGNFASVDMSKFRKFMFPIVSLVEQQRIVSILDRFDKLCNNLSEGLPAEINARQKQYEFYRDKLLTFNSSV